MPQDMVRMERVPRSASDVSYTGLAHILYQRTYGLEGYPSASPVCSNNRKEMTNDVSGPTVCRAKSMRVMKSDHHPIRQRGVSIPNSLTHSPSRAQRTSSNRSLPLPGEESEHFRLRNFAVTSKGVINRGDSFRCKSRSDPSVVFAESLSVDKSSEKSQNVSKTVSSDGDNNSSRYKILIVGALGVGKTAMIHQFMTSEYIYDCETPHVDSRHDNSVRIVLNGEESQMEFLKCRYLSMDATQFNPDAYIVVYSVTEKESYLEAKQALRQLRQLNQEDEKPVILVANKTDLVRLRSVATEEGRTVATNHGCKYIETSVGINHQVDELLVGTLSQIRMKIKKHQVDGPGSKVKGVIRKIFRRACPKSKSCDNFHVL